MEVHVFILRDRREEDLHGHGLLVLVLGVVELIWKLAMLTEITSLR